MARGGGALALLEVGDGLPALDARGSGAGGGLAASAEARVELAAEGLVAEELVGAREELEVGGGVGVVGAFVRVAQPRLRPVRLLGANILHLGIEIYCVELSINIYGAEALSTSTSGHRHV